MELDRAMRSGVGNHSHREALKRMQARADLGTAPLGGAAGGNGSEGLFSPQGKGEVGGAGGAGANRGRRSSSAKPTAPGNGMGMMRRGSSVTRWAGAGPGTPQGAGVAGGPMIRRRDSDLNRAGGGGGWADGRTSRQA
jgi:hypothetical protein